MITHESEEDFIAEGEVKWFDDTRGYGFIELDDMRDVHVHYSVVPGLKDKRYLMAGDRVKIVVGYREEGLYTKSVLKFTRGE